MQKEFAKQFKGQIVKLSDEISIVRHEVETAEENMRNFIKKMVDDFEVTQCTAWLTNNLSVIQGRLDAVQWAMRDADDHMHFIFSEFECAK